MGGLATSGIEARVNGTTTAIPGPLQHGFDHYLANIEGQPPRQTLIQERRLYKDGGQYMVRNDDLNQPNDPDNWTKIKGNEALSQIDQHNASGQPFFLNVWFDVPHTPYEMAPAEYRHVGEYDPDLGRDRHVINTSLPATGFGGQGDHEMFLSMVTHMDAQVGRIVSKLEELGIRDDTLILFASDNGGAWPADNGIYTGGKVVLQEGGIRVPMIASWPGQIPAGVTSDSIGHSNDFLPTILDAVGTDVPATMLVDGISLLPHLMGEVPEIERNTLFWQIAGGHNIQRHGAAPQPYGNTVARNGQWKLIAVNGSPVAFYDTDLDPTESNNLLGLAEYQQRIDDLAAELNAWLADPTAATLPNLLPDLDGDGDLDIDDWLTLKPMFYADLSNLSPAERMAMGDFNADGLIDEMDFDYFKLVYNGTNGPGSFDVLMTPIPEPASLMIVGVGIGLLMRKRTF